MVLVYNYNTIIAFDGISYLVNVLKQGWLIVSLHANLASFYMFWLYLHVLRSIYFAISIMFSVVYWLTISGLVMFLFSFIESTIWEILWLVMGLPVLGEKAVPTLAYKSLK